MHSINEITINHIDQLSPDQLSGLLHLLLKIEVEKNSLENCEFSVPQKINVADGGEDGRIHWTGNPTSTNWIKNRLTIYQSKATSLTPTNCYKEIIESKTDGQPIKLKSQVEDVVKNDGCYTLFTSQALNQKQKEERISEFRRAIQDSGHTNYLTLEIKIYAADEIKDWTNENIAAVAFIQSCIGITRPTNFRIWTEWENDMIGSEVQFQSNEVLLNNIKQIRSALKVDKVVRVIGHSGLGKTRMVLEAFRENPSEPEIQAQQAQLVYYDIGMGSLESISSYILSHKDHQSGIIVVDNCNENSHNTIVGLVRSSGNFKIITIDFSSETSERTFIKLERGKQKDIVQKIVEAEFQDTLTKTDKEFIANQSEGYPQMAILFSDSVRATGGLIRLNNELPQDFLKKLVFGRNSESDFEFEIIKACSVISSFGFIDDNVAPVLRQEEKELLNKQTDYIRKRICGRFQGNEVSAKEFYKVCLKYKATNIIEQRGTRIMVKPTPLAINLAAVWWRETPHDTIREILSELKDDELGKRLVERLTELDQLDKAKEIVKELWGLNSPFGTAEVLNTSLGSLLFRYVVEVNPTATARALEGAFGKMSKEDILKIDKGRRNLVWALEKLCFRKETFSIATKILYSFAVSENETWGNNATNQFRQLFQLYLAGTEANLTERLNVVHWGLGKNDVKYTELAILAMGRGLLNDHYTRMGGAEKQGSNVPLEDYKPNWKEIVGYWSELIKMLTEIACSEHQFSELAKEKIANSIRPLIRDGQFKLIQESIQKIIVAKGNLWTEASNNLKITLGFEEHLPTDIIEQIEKLIQQLTPTDLKNQLLLKITKPEWDTYEKDDNNYYIDKPKLNAEAFAKELIEKNISWTDYIQDLLQGEQRQGFNFGAKYSSLTTNGAAIVETAIQALKIISKEKQNPELLAGFLYGLEDRKLFEQTIDRFIEDEDLRQHSFYLTRTMSPTYAEISKLFVLVDKYNFSISQFKNFQYGRALDSLPPKEVIELCEKISNYGNLGSWTALSLLYMFCYSNEENWKSLKSSIKELISSSNITITNDNTERIDIYHWSDSIIKILQQDDEKEFAITIAKQIVEFCSQVDFNSSSNVYMNKVVNVLFEKYFNTVWDHFGEGLTSDYMTSFNLEHMIGKRNGYLVEGAGILFGNKDNYKTILEWCRKYPDKAPKRIAHIMPLNVTENEITKWHPFSKSIIDEFGDDEKLLSQLSSNMGTFVTVGSRVPYFSTQKKLLEELIDHKLDKVRNWTKEMLDYTEKMIKREKLDDEESSE